MARATADEKALVELLVEALEHAPHKHRIDAPFYWDWYDKIRQPIIEEARRMIGTKI